MAWREFHSTVPARIAAGVALLLLGTAGVDAQDRCEGTLCDFYYDHLASPQQQQPVPQSTAAAPPQQTQAAPAQANDSLLGRLFSGGSSQQQQATTGAPAPAKRSFVAVQGGGLIGMMQGNAPQRCTGTLCDLYYGGPPPQEPAAQPPAATPVAGEPAPEEEVPRRSRGIRTAAPTEERAACAPTVRDPWQCYR